MDGGNFIHPSIPNAHIPSLQSSGWLLQMVPLLNSIYIVDGATKTTSKQMQ